MSISDRLVPIICKHLKVEAAKVKPEARFREDLKANSLALILLQIAIEETFNVEISEADAKSITSLESATKYLTSKGVKE